MENETKWGAFKVAVSVALFAIVVCAAICTYKYVTGKNPSIEQNPFVESSTIEDVPTVEEAMIEWNDLRESNRCYEIYSNLPPIIMQALFEKLGTQEPVKNYVYEYEKNREYYISLQIADQLQEQGLKDAGVDGKRIKDVQIKTELEEEPAPEKVPIPATAVDSVL